MDKLTETQKVNLDRIDIFLRRTLGQTKEEASRLLIRILDKYLSKDQVINWYAD